MKKREMGLSKQDPQRGRSKFINSPASEFIILADYHLATYMTFMRLCDLSAP